MSADPKDQIRHEGKCLLNRWSEECDLECTEIAKALYESINEWMEEDIVDFEADFEIEDDDEDEDEEI